MSSEEIKQKIVDYVLTSLGEDSIYAIQDIDDNCGGFWINLKNGETYFLMVGKCEPDE